MLYSAVTGSALYGALFWVALSFGWRSRSDQRL